MSIDLQFYRTKNFLMLQCETSVKFCFIKKKKIFCNADVILWVYIFRKTPMLNQQVKHIRRLQFKLKEYEIQTCHFDELRHFHISLFSYAGYTFRTAYILITKKSGNLLSLKVDMATKKNWIYLRINHCAKDDDLIWIFCGRHYFMIPLSYSKMSLTQTPQTQSNSENIWIEAFETKFVFVLFCFSFDWNCYTLIHFVIKLTFGFLAPKIKSLTINSGFY